MLDVVDLFKEQNTRDELGIGAIRDAVADLLFPGTGTVQTRARYFLFIPWIYQECHLSLTQATPSLATRPRPSPCTSTNSRKCTRSVLLARPEASFSIHSKSHRRPVSD